VEEVGRRKLVEEVGGTPRNTDRHTMTRLYHGVPPTSSTNFLDMTKTSQGQQLSAIHTPYTRRPRKKQATARVTTNMTQQQDFMHSNVSKAHSEKESVEGNADPASKNDKQKN